MVNTRPNLNLQNTLFSLIVCMVVTKYEYAIKCGHIFQHLQYNFNTETRNIPVNLYNKNTQWCFFFRVNIPFC